MNVPVVRLPHLFLQGRGVSVKLADVDAGHARCPGVEGAGKAQERSPQRNCHWRMDEERLPLCRSIYDVFFL